MSDRATVWIDSDHGAGDGLVVRLPYLWRSLASTFQSATWDPIARAWRCEASPENLQAALSINGVRASDEVVNLARRLAPAEPVTSEAFQEQGWPELPVKGVTPFLHQRAGFGMAMRLGSVALLWEQGCGKSLATVAVACERWNHGMARRILIVAPVSVLSVWEREFREYAAAQTPIPFAVLTGTVVAKAEAVKETPSGVLAVNYESAWREPLASALRAWAPDMMVCDESQRIKDPHSKQSKGVAAIGAAARYRMILTGTPVLNSPLDFWAQYRFLDPTIFPASYYAFRARHAIMGGYENHQVIGYRHLDELVTKAHSIASRVTKASALDLPETLDEIRYCDLEPSAARTYRALRDDAIAAIETGQITTAPQMITRILRLQQLTGGWMKPDDGDLVQVSDAKYDLMAEVLEEIESAGKKVVVFARFLAEIGAIVGIANARFGPDSVVTLMGSVPAAERGPSIERFQKDPECRVMVAQTAVAGVGITLTAADTAIFYSCDYSYANHEQAKARIHRIGQRNACTYLYLVARNTIDEDILETLRSKRGLADAVVDDWRRLLVGRAK